MVSIPFLSASLITEKTFVRVYLPPTEMLSPMANSYGLIQVVEKSYASVPRATTPNGYVTVRFLVQDPDNVEHHFHTLSCRLLTIPPAHVPPDVIIWFEAQAAAAIKAHADAEKAFAQDEKRKLREARALRAHFANIFAKSRAFWRAWKGPGLPPVDPETGVSSTDRQPPDM